MISDLHETHISTKTNNKILPTSFKAVVQAWDSEKQIASKEVGDIRHLYKQEMRRMIYWIYRLKKEN